MLATKTGQEIFSTLELNLDNFTLDPQAYLYQSQQNSAPAKLTLETALKIYHLDKPISGQRPGEISRQMQEKMTEDEQKAFIQALAKITSESSPNFLPEYYLLEKSDGYFRKKYFEEQFTNFLSFSLAAINNAFDPTSTSLSPPHCTIISHQSLENLQYFFAHPITPTDFCFGYIHTLQQKTAFLDQPDLEKNQDVSAKVVILEKFLTRVAQNKFSNLPAIKQMCQTCDDHPSLALKDLIEKVLIVFRQKEVAKMSSDTAKSNQAYSARLAQIDYQKIADTNKNYS